MKNVHAACQWWGWIITICWFISVGYYHAAYDFNLDGRLDVVDLQFAVNMLLAAWIRQ
ncbi:MAG: hypothetical protein V1755_02290 [Chloroflexota bacterium]